MAVIAVVGENGFEPNVTARIRQFPARTWLGSVNL